MNNGPEFFQTRMGREFYESRVPSIDRSLQVLAENTGALVQLLTEERDRKEAAKANLSPEFIDSVCEDVGAKLSNMKCTLHDPEFIGQMIDQVEDMLSEYGIILPRSKQKQEAEHIPSDEMVSITGEDYDEFSDRFEDLIKGWFG